MLKKVKSLEVNGEYGKGVLFFGGFEYKGKKYVVTNIYGEEEIKKIGMLNIKKSFNRIVEYTMNKEIMRIINA